MNRFFHTIRTDHRLGLRIIKTGIAVTLCIVISNLLKLDQPLLAVIATVLSMGKSIDMSVRSGKNKMIGVLIGSVLGCGLSMINGANPGLCGLGIILVLYLCQLLRLRGASTLTSFAFAAVMFGSSAAKPWAYALTCAENALIGIAVAVIVNLIVMPPNYVEEVKRTYALLREEISLAAGDVFNREPVDAQEIETMVDRLEGNVRLYVSEARLLRGDDEEIFAISCKISTYRAVLDELRALNVMLESGEKSASGEMQAVYQYHLGRIRRLQGDLSKSEAEKAPPPDGFTEKKNRPS